MNTAVLGRWLLITGLVLGPAGCAGTPGTAATRTPGTDSGASMPPFTPAGGTKRTTHVTAGVLERGTIPYDNLSLPLASPDGRFIATETGVPPTWATLLAEPGAEIPRATRIEIHELAPSGGPPVLAAVLAEPAVLGRSVDDRGFLIESPRESGARWIGRVSWTNGSIEWLVQGDEVNAFAAVGPNGQLAWSRRAVAATHFDLVIRRGGEEWTIASQADDWVMPVWSGRGDGLFVLHLADGALHATHATASGATAFRQSVRRLNILSANASVYSAYQTVNSHHGWAHPGFSSTDQLVLFHPGLGRMAMWRPLSLGGDALVRFDRGSIAAYVDRSDYALVTTSEALVRSRVNEPEARVELMKGLRIVRPTASENWPYLLLSPGESQVSLLSLRLVPLGQRTW